MHLQLIYKFLLLFMFVTYCNTVLAKDMPEITAIPQINSSHQVEIFFTLKNTTRNPMVILEDELPWQPSIAMLFVVVDRTGGALDQIIPLVSPNFENTVELKSGASLSGTVLLSPRFPSLDTDRRKRQLIFFWTYQSSDFSTRLTKLDRVGGYFVVPSEP